MATPKLVRDLRLSQSYGTGVHAGGIFTIAPIVERQKPGKFGMPTPQAGV